MMTNNELSPVMQNLLEILAAGPAILPKPLGKSIAALVERGLIAGPDAHGQYSLGKDDEMKRAQKKQPPQPAKRTTTAPLTIHGEAPKIRPFGDANMAEQIVQAAKGTLSMAAAMQAEVAAILQPADEPADKGPCDCEGCINKRVLDALLAAMPDAAELYAVMQRQDEILRKLKR